jgi:DNA-binding response OmpR family regulator
VQGRKERQLTVLVVEDEPLVAKYLKALFESDGHTVRTAANRQQIVDELPKSPMPDLVVLDLMLPDADGFDVLQRMKSHPVLSDIPVVIVTTQSTRESVMKGLALGADGYFTKPFEVDILMRGMKAVLGQLAKH